MPMVEQDGRDIDAEERDLLRRSRGGDRAAFEALVGPHLPAARAFAARLLGNLDDAEDAVQDALIKTWSRLDAFRGEGRFRSWLLRIVFNQSTDQRRRATTRRGHEQAVPTQWMSRPEPAPGAALEQRETLARVRRAMDALPDKQRAVLHLRVVEELSYDEVGRVLDLTPGSARVYLVRARAELRARMAAELDAER